MRRTSFLSQCVEEFERKLILSELSRYGWNRTHTARQLGVSYRTLRYKIERLQIQPPQSTEGAA